MKSETIEYINLMFRMYVAEKERMMMDAVRNGFSDDAMKRRIEDYQAAYNAQEDFRDWREDQLAEVDDG